MALVVRKLGCALRTTSGARVKRHREKERKTEGGRDRHTDLVRLMLVCRSSGRIWQLCKLIITEVCASAVFSSTFVGKTAQPGRNKNRDYNHTRHTHTHTFKL